jgi:trehalose-6-phosphate synthase
MPAHPEQPEQMAEAINKALSLSAGEKTLRMSLLTDRLQTNTLADWWYCMTNKLAAKTEKEAAPLIKNA